ncbi:MAG: hypothetical protein GY694_18575 [Gammaproteobacteria bacterium]|nr:hypothetical protein [Gammaproteobacteria bacterium]
MKTLLISALFASITFTGTAQADNPLSNLIYEESSNIFAETTYTKSTEGTILSLGDDHNPNSVWSFEYEEYVDPTNYKPASLASIQDVNHYMGSNPTAAGKMKGRETFIYNEQAGEYHLQ